MALPAKIRSAVGFQVDAGNLFRGLGHLAVAVTTEFPAKRLVWAYSPRCDLVPLWGRMTADAGQLDMVRDGLGPENLPVTGPTFLGHVRRFRLMRVMAGDTGHQRIVGEGLNLRKTSRSAGVIAVAKGTVATLARRGEGALGWSFNVGRGRPMADLAGHSLVSGAPVSLDSLSVAEAACFPPGILNGLAHDLVDCSSAVVSPFPESLRQQEMPGSNKPADQHGKKDKQTC